MITKHLYAFLTSLCLIITFGSGLYGDIPLMERNSLIAFYQATNGDNWSNNTGWKTPPLHSDGFALPGTENNWSGITVSNDHVTEIFMMHNNLSGHIPPEIGYFSELKTLMLADNYTLTGNIPPEIGLLSELVLFQASVNNLTGPIPPEMGNLRNLKYLRLYANYLEGPIPPELGRLDKLDDMLMGINRFTGGIPPEFGNLINLRYLDFYDNRLDGGIPNELGNLTNLIYLGLYGNRMKGNIPNSFLNLQSAEIKVRYNALYTDNDTLQTFLDQSEAGWQESQTVAPLNVAVSTVSDTSVQLSWSPILYTQNSGGYRVLSRKDITIRT
jgi:Leucine-rich repeat (LRR) protein